MNDEETIIMQPKNNEKANDTTETNKKQGKGKKVAATAAAAVLGGVAGSGATYAATGMLHDSETEDSKEQEQEVQATEDPTPAPEAKVEEEPQVVEAKEEVTPTVEATAETESDYTGNNGADPVTPNPEVHATSDDNSTDGNEVQVLGVYETQADNGQMMQAAVLTNGEEIAAVVDVDYDGVADVLLVDENHNQQIDEGEVYDLSNDHVQMADYQQAYLAQQEQMQQQDHDTFAYNASDDQPDYNNDVDPSFA